MAELKITVKKSSKPEEKKVKWQDLLVGTVYKNREGAVLARGEEEGIVLLCYTGGDLWLEGRMGEEITSWHDPVEVLGQLTEIIVEKA